MILQRWQHVLEQRRGAVALHTAERTLTFDALDSLARQFEGSEARGPVESVMIGVLAAILRGNPAQVVEKDRERRVPACTPPPGTFLIKQTVGSSGVRRCQFFTAAQIIADVDRLHTALNLQACDAVVSAISPAHSYGLTATVLQTLLHGLPLHAVAEPFPNLLRQAMDAHEHAFVPGIPALWRAWLMAGVPMDRAGLCVSAGSLLTLELEKRFFDAHGRKLHTLYGTSESGAISYDALETPREDAADVGTLLPGVEACVTGNGLLQVKSDAVGLGYDAPLPGEVFGEGRFLTCDAAELNHASRLRWLGCRGAGINVAGRKLSPGEIAAKIRHTLALDGVRVHGEASNDPERCQQIVAELDVPVAALTMDLRQRACAGLAPWELPRRWIATQAP
jgi:acyl-coenzyme A synthetase/AMP-(fatty) acid ligase